METPDNIIHFHHCEQYQQNDGVSQNYIYI